MRVFSVGLILAAVAPAQLSGPVFGYIRDTAGRLRPLHGVPGAFVTGAPVIPDKVLSAASDGAQVLARTDSGIVLIRGGEVARRWPAPAGLASFGWRDGRPDWVRFADGSCRVWQAGDLIPAACPLQSTEPHDSEQEPLAPGWVTVRSLPWLHAVAVKDGTRFVIPEAEP